MKKQILHLTIIISALFSLFSCAPNLVNMKKITQPIPSHIAELEKTNEYKEFTKKHNVILLYNSLKTRIDHNEKEGFVIEREYHQIFKILKEQKFSDYTEIDEKSRIIFLSARTIKPSGRIVALGMDDIYLKNAFRYTTNDSSKIKTVKYNFRNVKKGDIVELILKIKTQKKKPNYVQMNTFVESSRYPVLYYERSFDIPTEIAENRAHGLNTRHSITNQKKLSFSKSIYQKEEQNRTTFTWKATLIPTKESESNLPCYFCHHETIHFNITPWATWKEMSRELYNLYIRDIPLSSEIVTNKAQSITAGTTDEREKIKLLANFVQQLYTNDTFSIHNYTLNSPESVLRRGYGTQQELAILLVALLRAIGITNSHPALVRAIGERPFDKTIMADYYGYLFILCKTKNGAEIWIDPTYYESDINALSGSFENRPALLLTKKGKSHLKRTAETTAEQNKFDLALAYTIDSSLELTTKMKGTFTGHHAYWNRNIMSRYSQNYIISHASNLLKDGYFNALIGDNGSISNFKHSNPQKDFGNASISFDAKINAFRQSPYDSTYTLDIFPFNINYIYEIPRISSADKRKLPLKLGYMHKSSMVTIDINYPTETLELVELPKKQTLNIDENKVQLTYSVEEKKAGHIVVTLALSRNAKVVSAEKFEEVRTFYLALKKIFKEQLIFKKR